MKVQAIFETGESRVEITPENDAEQRLLEPLSRECVVATITNDEDDYGEAQKLRIVIRCAKPGD